MFLSAILPILLQPILASSRVRHLSSHEVVRREEVRDIGREEVREVRKKELRELKWEEEKKVRREEVRNTSISVEEGMKRVSNMLDMLLQVFQSSSFYMRSSTSSSSPPLFLLFLPSPLLLLHLPLLPPVWL